MTVFICDDHQLFADALAAVFTARGWTVVGTASDPARAIAALTDNKADVCTLDLMFPAGPGGAECISALRSAAPNTEIVVITASADLATLAQAAEAGAAAIVFKDDDIDEIIDVVERAHAGNSLTDQPKKAVQTKSISRASAHELGRFLTPRELETLERLVHGETGTQLAANMEINYATARTHVQNMLTKLGVHSRVEAVAFAIAHSLVSLK